jgi:RHS repeat-associated protein
MLVLCSYKFTGKERDSESNLDNFGARYYGSALGRFTSIDPKNITGQRLRDPQQWNMYSHTRNNPLVFVDPDGKEIRFANADSAKHGLSDARAGLPPSQRSAVSTVTANGKTSLSVNADAAKAAGPNSLLGRLGAEAASSKVVQVNYVAPTDSIKLVGASGPQTTSLNDLTERAQKKDPGAHIDGLTMPAHGDSNFPEHSSDPGVTNSFISNDQAVDSPPIFYHEVVVHGGTFVATDSPTASSEHEVEKDAKEVDQEVKSNETKTQ